MAAEILTQKELLEQVHYDPLTGQFSWLRIVKGRQIGKIGSISDSGYLMICIDYRPYRSHRLAWLYMTGSWPVQLVDHIDGDKLNNRFDNLREVNKGGNQQNFKRPFSTNTSGYLGVNKYRGRWRAQICTNYNRVTIGYFDDPKVAHEAYIAAKRKLHPFGTL